MVASAPGRVNLIGEHTDYHEGFVLPVAIHLKTYGVGKKGKKVKIFSENLGESVEVDPLLLTPPEKPDWKAYVLGEGYVLKKKGFPVHGLEAVVYGEVPWGGGLSSSASVEVTMTALWNSLYNLNLSSWDIVKLSREAENVFAGVPCGIMDQTAAVFGKEGHALFLDCRSLEFQYVRIPPHWKIVVCDTGVRHSLASSEYKKRQMECGECLEEIKKIHPEVKALRDVKKEWLKEVEGRVSSVSLKRCGYVLEENKRVLEAISAFEKGDESLVGELFFLSHKGLKEEYEVSCEELDFLVEEAYRIKGVIGARMTGGGFGGNTVNLVREEDVDNFLKKIGERYKKEMGREAVVRVIHPSDGLRVKMV